MGLRCQSSASISHPRFLLFPLLEKGLSKKRERQVRCIRLHLEGNSFLRWTIRWLCLRPSWLGIAQTSLGLSTRYSVRSPFKSTVHFYRECKRVVLSVWDREQFYFCISSLFPFCIIISQQIAILWPKYKKNMFKVNFYVWFTLKVVASCRFPNYFQ